jgi:hypothetical protein
MRRNIALCFAAFGVLSAWGARADDSTVMHKDANWGIVQQNHGRTCIVVLNTDDRRHAFHFVIDGDSKTAQLGILQEFLPDERFLVSTKTRISVAVGPDFVQQMEFRPGIEGKSKYISAILTRNDLDRILSALEETPEVSVAFSSGEIWQIPAPEHNAAIAIDHCWKKAVSVMSEAGQ